MARRKRHNRRRRKGSLSFLYQLLCLVVMGGAIAAALVIFFKADHIAVEGNSRYTDAEILEASGLHQGDNLFFFNKYDVASHISRNLPYVEAVQINRNLPDTLVITVTECSDIVAVQQDGAVWLLCSTGKVVDSIAKAEDYPLVTGVTLTQPAVGQRAQAAEGQEQKLEQLLSLLSQLRAKGMLPDVQEIHMEQEDLITFRYLDRFDVEILPDADFDYKLSFLQAVVAKLQDEQRGTLKLTGDDVRFIAQ